MKLIKKIFYWFLLSFAIVVSGGIGASYLFSDKVEKLVLEVLNDNLQRDIQIKSLEFSVFSKFPKASVELNDVNIKGVTKKSNHLVRADKVFLSFELLSLFREKLIINEVSIEDATLNVEIDKNGKVNYEIFKKNSKSDKESLLDVNVINLTNVKLIFSDKTNELTVRAHSYNSSFSAELSSSKKIVCDWKGRIEEVTSPGINLIGLELEAIVESKITKSQVKFILTEGKLFGDEISFKGDYQRLSGNSLVQFFYDCKSVSRLKKVLGKGYASNLSSLKKGSLTVR